MTLIREHKGLHKFKRALRYFQTFSCSSQLGKSSFRYWGGRGTPFVAPELFWGKCPFPQCFQILPEDPPHELRRGVQAGKEQDEDDLQKPDRPQSFLEQYERVGWFEQQQVAKLGAGGYPRKILWDPTGIAGFFFEAGAGVDPQSRRNCKKVNDFPVPADELHILPAFAIGLSRMAESEKTFARIPSSRQSANTCRA